MMISGSEDIWVRIKLPVDVQYDLFRKKARDFQFCLKKVRVNAKGKKLKTREGWSLVNIRFQV